MKSMNIKANVQGIDREVTITAFRVDPNVTRIEFLVPGSPISPVLRLTNTDAGDLGRMIRDVALEGSQGHQAAE